MRIFRTRPGTTLPELLIVLALFAIAATLTAPSVRSAVEVYAVRGARDAAAALLSQARALALARGSAAVSVDLGRGRLALASPADDADADTTDLAGVFGVAIASDSRPSGVVVLHFDALGIGRFANHTLRFRRGDAEARLTLSSYGRPRRW